MTVTINGSSGITAPEVILDNTTADGGQVVLKSSGYSNWNLDNYSGRFRAYYNSTEYFTINSSGYVGIGTSSPRSLLNPKGSGSTGAVLTLENSSTAVGSGEALGSIEFYSNDASSGGTGVKGKIASIDDTGFGQNYALTFSNGVASGGGNSLTEKMRIDSSGNVGIGTSSPSQKLDVNGRIICTGGGYTVNPSGAVFGYYTGGSYPITYIQAPTSGGIDFWNAGTGAVGGFNTSGQFRTLTTGGGSLMEAFVCRAWVNFNGTGTVAIRASGNVSSITDNGTGSYTVNFSNSLPDANYAVDGTADRVAGTRSCTLTIPGSFSTSSCAVVSQNGTTPTDSAYISVAFFR